MLSTPGAKIFGIPFSANQFRPYFGCVDVQMESLASSDPQNFAEYIGPDASMSVLSYEVRNMNGVRNFFEFDQRDGLFRSQLEKILYKSGKIKKYKDGFFDALIKRGVLLEDSLRAAFIIEETFGKNAHYIYSLFPAMLGSDLSSTQICEMFQNLAQEIGDDIFNIQEEIVASCRAMRARGYSSEDVLRTIVQIADEYHSAALFAFKALTVLIDAQFPIERVMEVFCQIAEHSGNEAETAFDAFAASVNRLSTQDVRGEVPIGKFISMLESLNDHNRYPVLNLLRFGEAFYGGIEGENFLPHFNLSMDIVIGHRKSGYSILESVLEATESQQIPPELTEEEAQRILFLIREMNSFDGLIYRLYREEDEDGGAELLSVLQAAARMMLFDDYGEECLQQILELELPCLYSLIQIVIPFSGMSFIQKDQGQRLLKKIRAIGDLRDQIPKGVRGKTWTVKIDTGEWRLREGERAELGAIRSILKMLSSEEFVTRRDLRAAIEEYLQGNRTSKLQDKVMAALYRCAAANGNLREMAKKAQASGGRSMLVKLLEIFTDGDALKKILVDVLNDLNPGVLRKGKAPINSPVGFVKNLKAQWESQAGNRERILGSMISKFQSDALGQLVGNEEWQIAPESDLAREFLRLVDEERQVFERPEAIAEKILSGPINEIEAQKRKYENVKVKEGIELEFRVVKGVPYGMYGINAGVCVAEDLKLWKDRRFRLIAMIDKKTKQAVGFIQVYGKRINGKLAWIIMLQPSEEFMGSVDADELYEKTIAEVKKMARAGRAKALYIPTDPNIHSNRKDMQRAIAKANEGNKPIELSPAVHWSSNSDHDIEKVYEVWTAGDK